MELRDGSFTEDPRLDRLVQFDPRSRNFGVADVVPAEVRTRTWRLNERNDQGPDGACVGFGVGHRIAAAPLEVPGIDPAWSFGLYKEAQKIDPWPGEEYSGTSVLAGVKVAQERGYFSEYRWCFSVDDMMRALSNEGPIVVGTDWFRGMFNPRPSGLLEFDDRTVSGGHCYLIRGLSLKPRLRGEKGVGPVFRVTNSWGPDWGVNGECYIRVEDYERYLMPGADQCVPLEARRPRAKAQKRVATSVALGHWWFNRPRAWRKP